MHLKKYLESIDTSLVSKLPLIIYNRLLEDIVKAMRIFYSEGANILLYGDKKSCKKTLIRICSLILYERDCVII
jgi:Flp pilus assembly CpaF family ATPase